jgi:threonine/homoserine/homoserine lactone efflux protein
MEVPTLTLFVPACFALNMAPGPNNLLSLSNATRYGFRQACAAGIGRLAASAGMISLASVGLAAMLHASVFLFYGIKLVGAGYLFYLAVQLWRVEPGSDAGINSPRVGLLRVA